MQNVRKSLAKFRCSSHRFGIELGRHSGIPRNLRLCEYCYIENDNSFIEDEYHVFFVCTKYDEIRQNYLNNWYTGRKDITDFYNLLKIDNDSVIKKIAFYVNKLMKKSAK